MSAISRQSANTIRLLSAATKEQPPAESFFTFLKKHLCGPGRNNLLLLFGCKRGADNLPSAIKAPHTDKKQMTLLSQFWHKIRKKTTGRSVDQHAASCVAGTPCGIRSAVTRGPEFSARSGYFQFKKMRRLPFSLLTSSSSRPFIRREMALTDGALERSHSPSLINLLPSIE
jgi:hypothetical protein